MRSDSRPTIENIVRWTVASLSFTAVLTLFILMDFGDRGYHFDPQRTYASNLSAGDENGYDLSRLRVLQRCVGYIRSNYVDPSRADARRMIVSALNEVERRVPEFLSDPIAKGDHIEGITIRVGSRERTFELDKVDDLYTISWKLLDVFEYVAPLLSDTVESREVEYAAINGLLKTLDPHSILLTPSVYREMKLGTTGKFGGLGIVIGISDGRLVVQSVLDGTPAQRAGLKSADKILQINSESTINMSLNDAVKRLRGAPGTAVDVWIMRKSFAVPKKFRIVRSNITLASVTSRLLDGGVGYARIKNFQQSTGADLRKSVERLDREWRESGGDDLIGFVLDLRDNPGGLLDQAIEVSDLFMTDGVIVTTVGSGNKVREEKVASQSGTWKELPLVVLVNSGSASASEIVAGALRNSDRAVILGSQTFGKGSVQVIYDIDDAALKLTIAQYLTPGDESIQSVGITPHVELVPIVVGKEKIDLNLAADGGERSLENHLVNTARTRPHEPDTRVAWLDSSDDKHDFARDLATTMLTEAGKTSAQQMLVQARPLFASAEREQTTRLVEALARLDVDWNEGPPLKRAPLRATLTADTSEAVEAGRKVTLEIEVTNGGSAPVHRIRAMTRSDLDAFDGHDMLLGKIPPGESRRWKIDIDVPRSTHSQVVPVEVELFSDRQPRALAGVKAQAARVAIQGLPRPRFAYSLQVLDDAHGNGDGIANEGERIRLRVSVSNAGRGGAFETLAVLKNRGGEEAFITTGRSRLHGLAAGESRDVYFDVEVRDNVPAEGLKLELRLLDTVLRQRLVDRLEIPFAAQAPLPVEQEDGRWVVGESVVAVSAGASKRAGVLGILAARTLLHTDARSGEWLRAPLEPPDASPGTDSDSIEDRRYGWVHRDGVIAATDRSRVPQRARFEPAAQAQQPRIALTKNLGLETSEPSVRVAGEAIFPTLEEAARPDVYIFRGNDKVYFQRGDGPPGTRVGFDASIQLEPGPNEISIYARAGRDLLYKHRVSVYRR